MEGAEALFPPRATTTAADSGCSRRRSAGGDGGTTLFRSGSSDEDGGSQRTSERAERAIKYSAMREQLLKMHALVSTEPGSRKGIRP